MKNYWKILFLGTPAFAIPSLEMLLAEGYEVTAVVTQPDRPSGRGHKLVAPPVKQCAEAHGLPVYQYEKFSREGWEDLKRWAQDLMITAAFGQILPTRVLSVPRLGCINVHASLLPKYRGAAPIERALIDGCKQTGITTMYTVRAIDAGDILEQDVLPILPEDTGGSLREKLAVLGAETLRRTLAKLEAGTLVRTPQREEDATYAPMFERGFGEVDFAGPAKAVADLIGRYDEEIDLTNPFRYVDPVAPWRQRTFDNCTGKELQVPVFKDGKLVYKLPSLEEIRAYVKEQMKEEMWPEEQRFENPHVHYLDMTPNYYDMKMELLYEVQK